MVGGGQAGASLVAKLRALGHDGRITLFGEEPVLPYQRPPLSKKYLLGEMDFDRLLLRPRGFYDDNAIDVRMGKRVDRIDPAAKTIEAAGERLRYDVLALCTGSLPRRLPPAIGGDLRGVHVVRTFADVDRLIPDVTPGRKVIVIGGGYIGLEAAAVAKKCEVSVTLIEMAERILNRVACAETADFFRHLHRHHGVDVREGVGVERLTGDAGRVTGAVLSDGTTVDADFVIAGIGIMPDTRLAETAGLAMDDGIAVDALCRTSDPSIFAAGDCTSFPHGKGRLRLESVQNAIDQAEHAAGAIMGSSDPYLPHPWFWSDQYDCKLQIAGLNTGYDRIVVRPGSRPGGQSVWYFKGSQLLAVDAMNDPKAYMQAKRWIESGVSPDPGRIPDAETDLKSLA